MIVFNAIFSLLRMDEIQQGRTLEMKYLMQTKAVKMGDKTRNTEIRGRCSTLALL